MATTTDLYVAWGVEQGRELVYVDADGHSGEFEIISDADLQIDLYLDGYTYAQIRKVIRSVRYSRSQGPCDTVLYVQTPRRCSRREESCKPAEPPATPFVDGFIRGYQLGGCIAIAVIALGLAGRFAWEWLR